MFLLLLESIFIYGELDDTTEILIYTSTPFMKMIQQSHLFNDKIKFEINDDKHNIDQACKARLDLFELSSVSKYEKILYLDTDIMVKRQLQPVFDMVQDDILYVLEEGEIDSDTDWWGKSLFEDELSKYEDKTAFSSGIMGFKNCKKIKELFENIKEDMVSRNHYFHDQPFIIYNAFKYHMYNNKLLKSFVKNNDYDIHSDTIIHHFPGNPGIYNNKLEKMKNFLFHIKDDTISNNIANSKKIIDDCLIHIIKNTNEKLEGNIFMFHETNTYTDLFINKAKNISNLVLNKNIKNVMEIGFNSGFSTLLMLISNPELKITCFDLGEHKYTLPCYEELKEIFGDRIELIIGDSMKTLPLINNHYDLIHIDGGHSNEVAESDIIQSHRLSKDRTILIMDDYDFSNLHELWDVYIKKFNLHNLQISLYDSPHHDIKYVF
jgi:predicted O-methyltransferase YrrM